MNPMGWLAPRCPAPGVCRSCRSESACLPRLRRHARSALCRGRYLAARQSTFMHPAELSSVFSALADPTRRAILARLSQGEAPVKELAAPFDLSGPAITKHLNVLERAGLISRGREGQLRPCRLEPHAHAPAADWIDQCRAMWEERLDRLDSYLRSVRSDSTSKARGMAPRTKPKPRTPGGRSGRKL